ncbi:hypothetical protein NEFER03_1928 [Nematocida sp. LUAm3]|nr:hypothetical protein NEFER03_1928 [Nematocida sp. LUAm3]KAI5176170.1 hypothetical protein NEFER02_1984 [Nematocida sp. LUAm2]KAI5179264.1 hypothetical protein NEFER01_2116 [Nematocida sp. LUAm1]
MTNCFSLEIGKDPPNRKRRRTYTDYIVEALSSSSLGRATTAEIFSYLQEKYPEELPRELSRTWKSSIRQTLSRETRFIRLNKRKRQPEHEWTYFPIPQILEKKQNNYILYRKWFRKQKE